MRNDDVQTDRRAAGITTSSLGSLHDPGPATCDHPETSLDKFPPYFHTHPIVVVVFGRASGSKNGHTRPYTGQSLESVDKLGHDPEYPPHIVYVALLPGDHFFVCHPQRLLTLWMVVRQAASRGRGRLV